MTALDRKLLSDLRRQWGQSLAICLVLACGVGAYVMSTSTLASLRSNCDRYYRDQRFADVFAELRRAPNQLAARLADIPGVARLQTRVTRAVLLDMPGLVEPATARLVSLGDDPADDLNAVYLRQGRLPDPNRRGEVVVGEQFAAAHRLAPGDTVVALLNGKKERLLVVGVGISPEFVFAVQPGQMLPDDRRFGVFWMSYRQMAAAFDMTGAFNSVSATLLPGASPRDVMFRFDELTSAHGGLGAYGRGEQASHRRVADEMLQLRSMALVAPLIFLAVAAFLFNMVLSRMIQGQREEIAALKAFGYTRWEIGAHYGKFIALLAALGVALGVCVGLWMGHDMTRMYSQFFRFPRMRFELAPAGLTVAALLSGLAAFGGGWWAVRGAMRLPPAEAMRPPAPPAYHDTWLKRLGVERWLSPVGRMIARRLERNARPTALSVLGVALGLAVLVLGTFVEDAIEHVINAQFRQAQRQDVTLTFTETASAASLHDVAHLPGVLAVEPFRAVPARVRRGPRWRRVSIMGLDEGARLFRVLDENARPVPISGDGLALSEKLAELLDARVGDEVLLEVLEEARPTRVTKVSAVFPDYSEPAAYMRRGALHRLLREGERLSGAFATVDAARRDDFFQAVKQAPRVAGVSLRQSMLDAFRDLLAENLLRMRAVNAVFASIIALGVIYNCARVTLAERGRELATMRVLGFTRLETATVLLGELACVGLMALPVGLVLGYGVSWLTVLALNTETQRFPLVVSPATYAYSTTVILSAALASSAVVWRMLNQLDLIAVLKAKE